MGFALRAIVPAHTGRRVEAIATLEGRGPAELAICTNEACTNPRHLAIVLSTRTEYPRSAYGPSWVRGNRRTASARKSEDMPTENAPFSFERKMRHFPAESSLHFVIGGTDKSALFDRKARWLAWGKPIPTADRPEVRYLRLSPGPRQAESFHPLEYVSDLENLEYLALPFPFVADLDPKRLPRTLRTLQIAYDGERFGSIEAASVRWPAVSLPSVSAVFFGSDPTGRAFWPHLGVGREHLPRLEAVRAHLGEDERVLPALERMGALTFVELYTAGNVDLFGTLPDSLEYLFLNATQRKFDGSRITRLRALRSVQLGHIRSPLDLAWLESLPHLIELRLWSTKKLLHVESVLALEHLRRLSVVGCGKPFSRELAAQLEDAGLDQLDIRLA